jgi:hypothetical protein
MNPGMEEQVIITPSKPKRHFFPPFIWSLLVGLVVVLAYGISKESYYNATYLISQVLQLACFLLIPCTLFGLFYSSDSGWALIKRVVGVVLACVVVVVLLGTTVLKGQGILSLYYIVLYSIGASVFAAAAAIIVRWFVELK